MALLEVRDLTKSYPRRERGLIRRAPEQVVVDHVTFSIAAGETLGLVGESGCGKSTVARMVLGLIPPAFGDVLFDGQSIPRATPKVLRGLRRRFQPVFQDPFAALNPRMRIADILAEPFRIHRPGMRRMAVQEEIASLLDAVDLDPSALRRYPHEFSGGQRQRINIARALALRPELLILDEPLASLDVSVSAQVTNLLRRLQQSFHLTYLFISHSMPLVRYLATHIAVMRAGRLVEVGECEAVCQSPRDAYTKALLAATPELPTRKEAAMSR